MSPSITVPPALDTEGSLAFAVAVEAAAANPACRVIRIEGAAGVFCRGLDFGTFIGDPEHPQMDANAAAKAEAGMAAFLRCLRAIRGAGKPVVAVVDGWALGGGLGIAAACDLIIATPRATFGLPEVLFGLIPAAVLPLILERVPSQKARLWAMTGRTRTAEEAMEIGLIDALVPVEKVESTIRRWERDLSRASPEAVLALKLYTADVSSLPLLHAVESGANLTRRTLEGGDVAHGIRRFLAGETAPWLE